MHMWAQRASCEADTVGVTGIGYTEVERCEVVDVESLLASARDEWHETLSRNVLFAFVVR